MSQMVHLSDDLVRDAQAAAQILGRSLSDQLELWVSLGRTLDRILGGDEVVERYRTGAVESLSDSFALIGTPEGNKRVKAFLDGGPFPHYKAASEGRLLRLEADGTQSLGRFIQREWIAEADGVEAIHIVEDQNAGS